MDDLQKLSSPIADQPQTYHDEGFQDFRDFVNFIDGVGLSAQWSPEFGFDWLHGEQQTQQHQHQHHEPARPSREVEETHTPEPEDIGTPFSTWLPSAPADDQVHLRSHSGDGTLAISALFPNRLKAIYNMPIAIANALNWMLSRAFCLRLLMRCPCRLSNFLSNPKNTLMWT